MSIIVQQDATMYSLLYFCKLLYMFRVVTPPIIRSTYNAVPTSPRMAEGSRDGLTVPDAVITVICASDDGWNYYP